MDLEKFNIRLGKVSQWIFLGYGHCIECQTTWNLVKSHVVMLDETRGRFEYCEKCWNELSENEKESETIRIKNKMVLQHS